jgi:hypothetical protein
VLGFVRLGNELDKAPSELVARHCREGRPSTPGYGPGVAVPNSSEDSRSPKPPTSGC